MILMISSQVMIRERRVEHPQWLHRDFREMVEDCNLFDIPLTGIGSHGLGVVALQIWLKRDWILPWAIPVRITDFQELCYIIL